MKTQSIKLLFAAGALGTAMMFASLGAGAQDAPAPAASDTAAPTAGAAPRRAPPKPITVWASKPAKLVPYTPPNKLIWRLADILAKHQGKADWSQTVVTSRDSVGKWISMGPGEKTKTLFYADDRVYWVVQSGQMRITIEGQDPFVASKGFLIQVPERLQYSMETVGDVPSLRFEVTPNGEAPQYPLSETPTPVPGIKYIQATYTGHGHYDAVNKPYIDFWKDIVEGGQKLSEWVKDDHTYVTILRSQHGVPTPPPTEWGHFHENFPEWWFIEEGTQQFLVEGEPLVTAVQGDIVATPIGRWHRAEPWGDGPSTRLAFIPRPGNLHYFQPGVGGGD